MRLKAKVLVSCENARKGCGLQFEEKDRLEHRAVCLYEQTKCDICGVTLLLRDLVHHQKVKRCNEKLVQRLKIEHGKQVHTQVVNHFRRLHAQTSGRHVAYYKWYKSLAHKKLGWTTPVPPALSSRTGTAASARTPTRTPTLETRQVQSARSITLCDETIVRPAANNDDEFLLLPQSDAMRREQVPPDSARTVCGGVEKCLRCRKVFRSELNHDRACRWHRGVSGQVRSQHAHYSESHKSQHVNVFISANNGYLSGKTKNSTNCIQIYQIFFKNILLSRYVP